MKMDSRIIMTAFDLTMEEEELVNWQTKTRRALDSSR
jgi:hypothetical protein